MPHITQTDQQRMPQIFEALANTSEWTNPYYARFLPAYIKGERSLE